MARTSIDIDREIAAQAAEIFGTATLRQTIDSALREVIRAQKRENLIRLLSEPGRFDFDAAERAWGADK